MSRVRRRAGWLTAMLLLLSVVLVPREGAASGPWRWVEPPGPPTMGDPDTPPSARRGGAELEIGRFVITQPQLGYFCIVPRLVGGKSLRINKSSLRRSVRR